MNFRDLTVCEFKDKTDNNTIIIDIRDKDSYMSKNIPNSKNYTSEDIMRLIDEKDKSSNIIIYCYKGNSSRKVAQFLSECGFKNVYNLIGGFKAWKDSLI